MSLVQRVEDFPDAAQSTFSRVDEAVNLVLPGSTTHQRYRDIESVGLAIVIARDYVEPNAYNPFDPDTLGRLSFRADNRDIHPETWAPKDVDQEMLGDIPPVSIGRFTAFALAKINSLLDYDHIISSAGPSISRGLGKVGLAGGQRRRDGTLLGTSGLWEVHDHFVGLIYEDEVNKEVNEKMQTADQIAERVETVLGRIHKLHEGVEAADLDRRAVEDLVSQFTPIIHGIGNGRKVA